MRRVDLTEKSRISGRGSHIRSFPRGVMRIWSRILPATLVLVALFATLAGGGAFDPSAPESAPAALEPPRPAVPDAVKESGTLVAFVAPDASAPARAFQDRDLPRIKALARDMGLEFRLVNVVHRGAPAEVGITPLLVFQNHRGRSTYQGRTRNLDRIQNFLRTARAVPQAADSWRRDELPVRRFERCAVGAPLKITALSGTLPEGFDAEAFEAEARRAILRGLRSFSLERDVGFGRSDRSFYLDFYPYRDAAGKLFVSVALFSQFHCKEAIFKSEEPLSGPYAERAGVFERAARALELEVERQLRESELGDAFDPLGPEIETRTWEELDLALPPRPEGVPQGAATAPLGRRWSVVVPEELDRPILQFRFPPPLDGTSGEALSLTGELELGEGLDVARASGKVVVDVNSITLGYDDLDEAVLGETMLNAIDFPDASFTLEAMSEVQGRLAYGEQLQARAAGTFRMKGVSIPLAFQTLWEPVVSEDGSPRLLIQGAFTIRLKEAFGISGPDGPLPQKDTLLFDFDWALAPR